MQLRGHCCFIPLNPGLRSRNAIASCVASCSSSLEAKAATPSTSAPQAQNGRQGAAALAHGDGGSDSGGAVATQRQYMIVMRHGQRIDEVRVAQLWVP